MNLLALFGMLAMLHVHGWMEKIGAIYWLLPKKTTIMFVLVPFKSMNEADRELEL